jgi:hypothetical protein
VQDDSEGGVFVKAVLSSNSADLKRIQPYDRVVAVSASLGDRMWKTNSIEGVSFGGSIMLR